MPYDDPTLKEFAGYFAVKEPGRRKRADAWATAIGLVRRVGADKGGHWEVRPAVWMAGAT